MLDVLLFYINWTDNTIAVNKCNKKLRIEQQVPQLNWGFKETRKDSSSCSTNSTCRLECHPSSTFAILGSNWDNGLSVNDECKMIIIPHVDLWSRAVKKIYQTKSFLHMVLLALFSLNGVMSWELNLWIEW